MTTLTEDIAAYEEIRAEVELDHFGEWVVVHNGALTGTYESFDAAAPRGCQEVWTGPLPHSAGRGGPASSTDLGGRPSGLMIEVECGFSDPGALQLQGPTIDVRIGFDEHFAPGSSPSIPENPLPRADRHGRFRQLHRLWLGRSTQAAGRGPEPGGWCRGAGAHDSSSCTHVFSQPPDFGLRALHRRSPSCGWSEAPSTPWKGFSEHSPAHLRWPDWKGHHPRPLSEHPRRG